jgi:hypothetical protein
MIFYNIVMFKLCCSKYKSCNVQVTAVYVVPNVAVDILQTLLDYVSERIDSFPGVTILCGDFNLPNILWSDYASVGDYRHEMFVEFCWQHGLSQHVKCPTRDNSVLDLVLSNDAHIVSDTYVDNPFVNCDHNVVNFKLMLPRVRICSSSVSPTKLYNFNKANFSQMASILRAVDWSLFFIRCVGIWWDFIMRLVSACVPLRNSRGRRKAHFLPRHLRNLLLRRNNAWRQYQSGAKSGRAKYMLLRSRCKVELHKYFKRSEEQFICTRNPKRFFSFVNSKLNASHSVSRLVLSDGSCVTNHSDLADTFCAEFCKNYCNYKTCDSNAFTFPIRTSEACCDPIFDVHSVYKALCNSSNSAAGPDLLPGIFIRSLAAELAPSLVIIFQQSFFQCKIPNMWRLATVKPVFKKCARDLASNYRPISLTCVACKLMESIVRDTMYAHVSDNGLLNAAQHGFRAKHSTATSLLVSVFEYIQGIENKSDVDIIMFDFAKAFDIVNHDLLLIKLRSYGFGKNIVTWLSDFLYLRQQSVSIGSELSDCVPVPSGVIQGSAIGPLLFLIFINDLPEVVRYASVKLFADDLKLYCAVNNLSDRRGCKLISML